MPNTGVAEVVIILSIIVAYVVIATAVVALVVRIIGSRRDDPAEILRARFARGEITRAEFEESLRLLDR